MPALLLATKLHVPPVRPDLVPRPHLIAALDEGMRSGHKLILISAPAGYGKTTLLATWSSHLHASSRPGTAVAWLTLDEGDSDPARFFVYLVAALQVVAPTIGQAAQAMTQAPQPPPPEALLTALINDLASVPSPFVLVLDDYHLIKAVPVHRLLAFLVDHQPEHMHLAIGTREDPPLPMASLRARGQVLEIRQADLQFSLDETAGFFSKVVPAVLSPAEVAALHGRTEGWAAGLQLAALSLRGRDDVPALVSSFAGSQRYVLDYLMEEVFGRQPTAVQQFLLNTSILERLTASLCDSVTQTTDSQAMLQGLEESNLFTVPLDQARQWYRYHSLFRDLLRHRRQSMAAGDIAALHTRASIWYESHSLAADAIRHALAAEDWERAADLIASVNTAMLNRGEIVTLLGWFGALPQDFVRARPRLCHEYSWPLLLAGQIDAAEDYLALAERGAAGDSALLGWIASGQAYAARIRGDGRRVVEQSLRSLALAPADDWVTRAIVGLNLGLAYWYAGRLDQAHQALLPAQEAAQRSGNLYARITAQTFLSRIQAARGNLRAAATSYVQVIEQGQGLPVTAMAHADLAKLLYEQNDLQAAVGHAQQSVAVSKASGNPEYYLAAVRTLALGNLAQGDLGAARHGMAETLQLAQDPGISQTARLHALACSILIALGLHDLDEASRLCAQLPPPDAPLPAAEYALLSLAHARLLLAEGRRAEAAAVASTRHERLLSAGFVWNVAETRTLQAVAAETTDEALAFLAQALPLAEREGCMRTFVDLGEHMAALLREAAARHIAPDYIGRLLAAFRAEEHRGDAVTPAHIEQPLVEPISDRELSVLRMLAEHTNQEIASALYVSDNTVKAHLKSIYGKLAVHSRHEAAAKARKLGLLS